MSKVLIQPQIMLHHHTTWRVGGPAEYFVAPENKEQLQALLNQVPQNIPVFWLGLGSNILVRDKGIQGYVISSLKGLQKLELIEPYRVRAEAGVSCAKLARFAARLGYTGGEFLAGIPGTTGGALAMNAGCWGGETWELVEFVETIDRNGEIHIRKPEYFQVGYREVIVPNEEKFVAGHFHFTLGEKESSLAKIRELLDKRAATQPTGDHSCGSVFRNPAEHHAAKLIEQTGLKGYTLGGAQVSTKHANFIINLGHASAMNIENLIEYVAGKVEEKTGIQLVREVKIIGNY